MPKGKQRGKKPKTKSILSDELERKSCDCEATTHPLVNNCLNCGKIVCLSEGPGPCFFCGEMVHYSDEIAPNLSKEFEEKFNLNPPQSQKSLELRDKLLEFDKNSISRTSVIDDESDYYQSTNNWMTKEEREKWKKLEASIQHSKHKSRLEHKLSVDMYGNVIEENDDPMELYFNMNSIQSIENTNYDVKPNIQNKDFGPLYINSNEEIFTNSSKIKSEYYCGNRVQDKGLLEISDQGVCLSMHQPYASLLVRGIKKTEGRTWYTSHRGRLWIASAAKEATAQEIETIEMTYRLLEREDVQFPKTYPTGCLIGCVNISDVLSQEEYNKLYPNERVDSPYIFMCDNYFELPVKYPMQGKHKIYKLDPMLHRAALNSLERACAQMAKNK